MSKPHPFKLLALAMALSAASTLALAQNSEKKLEEMTIYGEQGETDTATKLDLSLFETPQTVTAIARAQIDDFALTTFNELLAYTPGVTVESVETDRTYYTARGFDIVNFQYDGVGIPFISGINLGQQDTAIYEKVEVVKGAAGLITGLANPSATINYLRKRPTEAGQASTALSLSQWSGRRVEADISAPLSSRIRSRAVLAYDASDSYLDRHQDESRVAYGIGEFDLSDSTLLTLGHSHDNSHSTGVLWGALPLLYSDGTQTDFDVSTSTAPEWTFADSVQNQSFAELKHALTERWSINAVFTRNRADYESELFYVYGAPDRETGLGLNGWASAYDRKEQQDNADVFVSGSFSLAGREHQLVFGYSDSTTQLNEASRSDPENGFRVLGADWAEGNTPELNFSSHNPATQASNVKIEQNAFYFASRLQLLDELALLLGTRHTELKQRGRSYGVATNTDADKLAPYLGLTYQLLDDLMLYGSYNEVFKQQTWAKADLQPLGATLGKSKELGLKRAFNDRRAVLTLAVFSSDQSNFGVFVNRNDENVAIYRATTVDSQGYEIEFSGELFAGLNIGAGFTKVDMEGENGEPIRRFIPSESLKLSSTWQVPAIEGLKIGGVIKWQDEITTENGRAKQQAYTLLDLALHYALRDNLSLSLNLANLSDEKYLSSLYWDQAYYGAPRNLSASLRWSY